MLAALALVMIGKPGVFAGSLGNALRASLISHSVPPPRISVGVITK